MNFPGFHLCPPSSRKQNMGTRAYQLWMETCILFNFERQIYVSSIERNLNNRTCLDRHLKVSSHVTKIFGSPIFGSILFVLWLIYIAGSGLGSLYNRSTMGKGCELMWKVSTQYYVAIGFGIRVRQSKSAIRVHGHSQDLYLDECCNPKLLVFWHLIYDRVICEWPWPLTLWRSPRWWMYLHWLWHKFARLL